MSRVDSRESETSCEMVRSYLSGEVEQKASRAFAEHMSECEDCTEYLLALWRLRNLVSLALSTDQSFVLTGSKRNMTR